jgi:subtilisin family serine protease
MNPRHSLHVAITLLVLTPALSICGTPAAATDRSPGASFGDPANPQVLPGQVIVRLTADAYASPNYRPELGAQGQTGLSELDAALASIHATSVRPVLRFRPAADTEPARRLLRSLLVSYEGGAEPRSAAASLVAIPGIENAGPNGVISATIAPNDPYFLDQWAHQNTGQAIAYDGTLVGDTDCDTDSPAAWDVTTGSSSIKIAIIDTGVDLGHPEFAGRLATGYDFVHGDTDPSDDNGHGTCCASIAAAAGNNAQGVAGMAWDCRIIVVKILDSHGQGDFVDGANGIIWAANQGAQILSCSFGSYLPDESTEDAVAYAYGQGCAIFCATGNDDFTSLEYPAAYSAYTISGGALSPCSTRKHPTSCDGEDWWGSNYGSTLGFLTPGVRMHAADIRGAAGFGEGDYITDFNGTSAATPHAAGIGALVLSLNPTLTPSQLETILKRSSEDMGAQGYDNDTGFGRLNAHLAVLSAFAFPIYVNHTNTGGELGTLHYPYNTFGEGVAAVAPGGTIVVYAGLYSETMTITKPMTVYAKSGTATIGR